MTEPRVLVTGLVLGESPRWHDDQLWVCDWGAHEILTIDEAGSTHVVTTVPSFPFCIDWLPDGRLLVVAGSDGAVLRREPDGSLATHADLAAMSHGPWNEIVVDGSGNAYVNGIGFDLMTGESPRPGLVALVTATGDVRQVADDVAFPNGMVLGGDGSTLLLAESYASRITAFDVTADGTLGSRRVWAQLDGAAPDGICLDEDGAVWYADVPNQCCVRVAEGGEVLQRVELDRGCFACALGGEDGRTLFMVTAEWNGPERAAGAARTGQVVVLPVTTPAAPRPT